MKKITLLSLLAVSVLFTACSDDTKKVAAEATAKTTSEVSKVATDLAEATKEKAAELAKEAENAAEALKQKAEETTKIAKEELSKVVIGESTGEAGKMIYAKCAGCHGKNGQTKALGKSAVIAGQSEADLAKKLKAYKEGTRDVAGMGPLMKGQVVSISESDILAVSEYISGL